MLLLPESVDNKGGEGKGGEREGRKERGHEGKEAVLARGIGEGSGGDGRKVKRGFGCYVGERGREYGA